MPYLMREREHGVSNRTEIERSTRQEIHPIATRVCPLPPANARYHIEIWEPNLCNWGHYGYARDEAERSRLLDSIRAFSHRGRATRLADYSTRRWTPAVSGLGRRVTVVRSRGLPGPESFGRAAWR